MNILGYLSKGGVSLTAQTGLQIDLDTSQGKSIANLVASLAEFEHNLLRELVRSGTALAKAKGKRFGRKPGYRPESDRLAPEVMRMVEGGYSQRKVAKELNLSKTP